MPSFIVPTETVYGWGCAAEVGTRAAAAGFKRALLVTDAGVRRAGLTEKVESSLREAGMAYEVYDAVSPNPRDTEVEACFAALQAVGADLLVAIGGGSVMDCAKAAGILRTNGGRPRDWSILMEGQLPPKPCMPLYALTTTTGTGSETSGGAVITFDYGREARKGGVGNCQPALAFLDPELVVGLPADVMVSSGLDALTHATESYVSQRATLHTRAFSAQAIRTLAQVLPAAADAARTPGADRRPSMEAMLYAANIAGRAMLGGLGQVHALSHVVSAHFDTPHGFTNAIMLTSIFAHHQRALQPLLAEMGYLLGDPACAPGSDESAAAGRAIDAIARLRERVGAPTRLRDLNVPRESIAQMAIDATLPEPNQNPCPAVREDFQAMYERAW
ncbi:MAG TPA: iron-containing alcohol dehydrogenase [Chloroflexota bacterium]|nr:iron-containing alcohol dehydrogenase [Chloroflexota bacterium]